MFRSFAALLLATVLGGCATTPYTYYGERGYERYPSEPDRGYDDGYYDDDYGYDGSYYAYPDYIEYPAYYSLFWSFNRNYVDPYWHPHFYYGVTWFPRNYFSVSYRSWPRYSYAYRYGWPHYSYLSYSPYRGAWSDYYYDWYPWYSHHSGYHYQQPYYAPRYGSAGNEAERLSRFTRYAENPGRGGYFYDDGPSPRRWDDRAGQREEVIERREAVRGADYSGRGSDRIDPGVGGFRGGADSRGASYGGGRVERGADSRRYGDSRGEVSRGSLPDSGARTDPGVSGFQNPRNNATPLPRGEPRAPVDRDSREQIRQYGNDRRADSEGIPYPYRSDTGSRGGYGRGASTAPREDGRGYSAPAIRDREPQLSREANAWRSGGSTRDSSPEPSYREDSSRGGWSTPAPSRSREADRYQAPERSQPRYEAPEPSPRYEAPERSPRFEAPERSQPRYEAPEPSPRFEAPERSEPRFEAPERSEPRYEAPDPPARDFGGDDGGSARDELIRQGDSERR